MLRQYTYRRAFQVQVIPRIASSLAYGILNKKEPCHLPISSI